VSAPVRDRAETALAGILVVELGSRIAAGVCGSLLAQLGATVVLVETGQPARPGSKWQDRAQFAAGKLSVLVDPAKDRTWLENLIGAAGIVITASDTDGAAWPRADDARKVVCDITAYGREGGRAGVPDGEFQIQAVSGITETTGLSDGPPVPIVIPVVEYMTGIYAAGAAVAALRVTQVSGVGQFIDMALYDCAFAAMATFLPRVLIGSSEPIKRIGNQHTMIAPWNVYRAGDGWILVCVGNDAQWRRFCETTGQPGLADHKDFAKTAGRVANKSAVDAIVQRWVERHTVADCLDVLNGIQIACGPVVGIDGFPREANLEYRAMIGRLRDPASGQELYVPASPLRMSVSPGLAPDRIPACGSDRSAVDALLSGREPHVLAAPLPLPTHALSGLRIVEIGHYTTVPLGTRVLASLGAEVIKIEPPEGEATRDWPPAQDGQGYFFTYTNSDKRSLTLDLRRDADVDTLRSLLKTADILVENLKPGTLARRGLSVADLLALNPRLIYCGVSGFGAHSLYAGRPAYDTVIQAMSGLMDVVRAGDVPLKTGISVSDLVGAEFSVLALLAALAYRDRTGRGQYIDLSMQDMTAWMTQSAWNGGDPSLSAPTCLSCRDGFVVAEPGHGVVATTDIASSTRAEAVVALAQQGVAAAPVLTVHEMVAAPQTRSRDLWFTVTGEGKTWPLLASPLRLTGTPPVVARAMPRLGRDNPEIQRALAESKSLERSDS